MNSIINFEKGNGLVPVIIQDETTLQVLMLGFMNEEALKLTEETGKVYFFSRTKNRIWLKGESLKIKTKHVNLHVRCRNVSP